MKTIVFALGALLLFGSANDINNGTAVKENTVKQCIKVKCGNKAHFEEFTGSSHEDIAAQIKDKYNSCIWTREPNRRCKKRIESKF